MEQEKQPIAFLFEEVAIYKPEDVDNLIDGLTEEQAKFMLTDNSSRVRLRERMSLPILPICLLLSEDLMPQDGFRGILMMCASTIVP